MNYIIIDDEPLARKAVKLMAERHDELHLSGQFNSAKAAMSFMETNDVDLIFLDIDMPEMSGMALAHHLPDNVLIIFTTAYSEFAVESYEVNTVDYLVKPIEPERFDKAVNKAIAYGALLEAAAESTADEENTGGIPQAACPASHFFVTSERRHHRIEFSSILFIQGLKDYVVIQTDRIRVITHMNLSVISKYLPKDMFHRVSKSYIINIDRIDSFDNNDIYIAEHIIPLGSAYRDGFSKNILKNNPHKGMI